MIQWCCYWNGTFSIVEILYLFIFYLCCVCVCVLLWPIQRCKCLGNSWTCRRNTSWTTWGSSLRTWCPISRLSLVGALSGGGIFFLNHFIVNNSSCCYFSGPMIERIILSSETSEALHLRLEDALQKDQKKDVWMFKCVKMFFVFFLLCNKLCYVSCDGVFCSGHKSKTITCLKLFK